MTLPRSLRAALCGPLTAAAALAALVGCASDDPALKARAVSSSSANQVSVDSPEVAAIDERLASLDQRATAVRSRIDDLQTQVAEKIGAGIPATGLELSGAQLFIEVDEQSLIRANGILMSRSDFESFAQTRGKTLCTPSPVLAVDTRANYDTVVWVLDRIYAEGCPNVDILEATPTGDLR